MSAICCCSAHTAFDRLTLKMNSSSIGIPSGRLATPITNRTGRLSTAEDIAEQIRGTIGNLRLVEEISGCCYEHAQANDACDSIERAQVLVGRG